MTKTQRPQRPLLPHPGEDRPRRAAGTSLVRLFGSGGWILRHKHCDKPLGTTASSDAASTFGWGGWPSPNSPGMHVPPESAHCRCQTHTFRCHESSVPRLALGDLLSPALAVLPVPRTITHSAPQYISHCISCLIWQQN